MQITLDNIFLIVEEVCMLYYNTRMQSSLIKKDSILLIR